MTIRNNINLRTFRPFRDAVQLKQYSENRRNNSAMRSRVRGYGNRLANSTNCYARPRTRSSYSNALSRISGRLSQIRTGSKPRRGESVARSLSMSTRIRNDYLTGVFKSLSVELADCLTPGDISHVVSFVDGLFKADNVRNNIAQAMAVDLQEGDKAYPNTLKVIVKELGGTVLGHVADKVVQRLLAECSPAAAIAVLLGPELIDIMVNDLPGDLEALGFSWDENGIHHDYRRMDLYHINQDGPRARLLNEASEVGLRGRRWIEENGLSIWDGLGRLARQVVNFRDRIFGYGN